MPPSLTEFTGPPSSLMWRGGAVHLRSGSRSGEEPDLHSHFAIQISVGMCGPIVLRGARSTPERTAIGWLVGSDQPHWMHTDGVAATIFFDPLTDPGRRSAARLRGAAVLALPEADCETVRRELEECWRRGWRLPDVRTAAGRVVDLLTTADLPHDTVDPRVRAVIGTIMQDVGTNLALAELARSVGLSESRLAHLFRRDVGIPMRQYRLWRRMERAVTRISLGDTLTEAAHMAGFSDSAHFCRTCRRMFGSAPSDLPEFKIER